MVLSLSYQKRLSPSKRADAAFTACVPPNGIVQLAESVVNLHQAVVVGDKGLLFRIGQDGVVIAVCGGYQLLGKYYQTDDGLIEGLELVDLYTEQKEGRLISNIVLKSDLFDLPVVGFENHGGRTFIGANKPFGKVLYGNGNDGESGYEGVVYKNVIGTYLHGPLLPKNPQVADYLIRKALERKYNRPMELKALDDSEEKGANDYIYNRFVKKAE